MIAVYVIPNYKGDIEIGIALYITFFLVTYVLGKYVLYKCPLPTKFEICQLVIDDFCKTASITRDRLNASYVTQSSSLAVAMEHIGLLDNPKDAEYKAYAASRAGIGRPIWDKYLPPGSFPHVGTLREILALLPAEETDKS